MQKKVQGAMVYPIIFADDGGSSGGGLDELCGAKIVKVFERSDKRCPGLLRWCWHCNILTQWWWLIYGGLMESFLFVIY